MNKINDEPISSQLVILRNVKEDSTEQFNKKGYRSSAVIEFI